jgi:RimK-like ATP-grasp domain
LILLCGIPSEPPLARVREELERLGAHVALFDQRRCADAELAFRLAGGRVTGVLRLGRERVALETFVGVYTRAMDEQLLPELRGEPPGSPPRRRARAIHDALAQWLEICPARVVNRARPQGSNSSKPYQAQLIRAAGFVVPETLVTNDPDLVREFVACHGRVVYKSMSGVRSIVRLVGPRELDRLELIRWCPVQFQAWIPGLDVRVHVVGEEVFATAVHSPATDYRYATADRVEAVVLDGEVADRCVALAAQLELPFAGVDLRVGPAGEAVCLEVNPSPAFTYYESRTGQPIARAVARYLHGV